MQPPQLMRNFDIPRPFRRVGQDDMAEIMVEIDPIGNLDDGIPHRFNLDINGMFQIGGGMARGLGGGWAGGMGFADPALDPLFMRPPGGLDDIDPLARRGPRMFGRGGERALANLGHGDFDAPGLSNNLISSLQRH